MIDVCAAAIRKGDRFLLATRPDGSHMAGKWEFPGGKVRPHEPPFTCISREIHEELNLEVTALTELATVVHHDHVKAVRLHFIACELAEEHVLICHEGQQAHWFTVAEALDRDLAPGDRQFIEDHLVPRLV